MRILLVNPNTSPALNMGLGYIISSVGRRHQVRLLDTVFHLRHLRQYLASQLASEPDIVGFSVQSFNIGMSLAIARQVKERYPRAKIVFGGVYPTIQPEQAIAWPLVDAICIGEGEHALLEYADKLEEGREPAVAGFWYKDKDGAVRRNALRPFNEDIDSLPFPDWEQWEIEKYMETGGMFVGEFRFLSSRGCYGDCTFCCNPVIRRKLPGRYYRVRDPVKVVEEIQLYQDRYSRRGFRIAGFIDDLFGADKSFIEGFCDNYMKQGLHRSLPWACQTRPDVITDDWARRVAEAGCILVSVGLESGDEYIRQEVYRKHLSSRHILEADRNLRRHKIRYFINVILGCPGEAKEHVRRSERFLRKIKPLYHYYTFYLPLAETELAGRVSREMVLEKDIFRTHRVPKITTGYLKARQLSAIMFKYRLRNLLRFIQLGFSFRKLYFILDIISYLLPGSKCRILPLEYPHIIHDLERHTIYNYILKEGAGKIRRLPA